VILRRRATDALIDNRCLKDFPFATPDGWVVTDTETTGLDPWRSGCRPFAFSFANADGDTAYARLPVCPRTREVIIDEEILAPIRELMEDPSTTKVLHNAIFDLRMYLMLGIEVAGPIFDTMVGMHVINPDEMQYGLKYLGKRYLGVGDQDQKDLEESVKRIRAQVGWAKRRVEAGNPKEGDAWLATWTLAPDDVTNGKDASRADYWMADPDLCEKYARLDGYRTAVLYEHEKAALDEDRASGGRLWEPMKSEIELQPNLFRMENRGIAIDIDHTMKLREEYQGFAVEAKAKLTEMGLADLNPKSPKQVCEYFFGVKDRVPTEYSTNDEGESVACVHCATPVLDPSGKPVRRETMTKTGKRIMRVVKRSPGCKICQDTGKNPKCDGEYLQKIAWKYDKEQDKMVVDDEVAYWMLRYDGSKHMLVNFFDVYLALADEDPYSSPGNKRLHPNYKQVGPVTGRLACERPNLMQVASDDTPRKHSDISYRTRECFVARENYYLYLPDYSQVEIWLFASLAKDKTMLDILLSGRDFHGTIAHTVWGSEFNLDEALRCKNIPESALSEKELKNLKTYVKYRKRSKMLMFGKLYGGGPGAIGDLLQTSEKEAKVFMDDYDRRLPGIPRFMKECIRTAKERGYIINPFGRKYPIPGQLAYKSTNYMIQGSAASVMKRSINRISALSQSRRYAGRMFPLLNIHDEHVIEVHKSIHGKQTMQDIISAMQGDDHIHLGCPVPLPVGMKFTKTRWSDVEEVKGL
jgi:DNA polymerase I-like protein with 3'-5' exonuclease and polymerase domains